MPVFTFSGKNTAGEKVAGERVAPNKQALATQLRREQISAPTIREKGKEFVMPTLGAVPGDFGCEPGEPGLSKVPDQRPYHGRRRRDPRQRHASAP